jgi:hypothetical protein
MCLPRSVIQMKGWCVLPCNSALSYRTAQSGDPVASEQRQTILGPLARCANPFGFRDDSAQLAIEG